MISIKMKTKPCSKEGRDAIQPREEAQGKRGAPWRLWNADSSLPEE